MQSTYAALTLGFGVDLHAFIKIVNSRHMSLYELPNNLVTKIMYNIIHLFLYDLFMSH